MQTDPSMKSVGTPAPTTRSRPGTDGSRTHTSADRTMRAMASTIALRVTQPGPHADACLARAEEVFHDVERACSRFDPASALARANVEPDRWHDVPATMAAAVQESARAHVATEGLFDPRIIDALLAWGYDRSLPFVQGDVLRCVSTPLGTTSLSGPDADAPWRPQVVGQGGTWRVHLGGHPIDLGGIGKGLAVRRAAAELAGAGRGYLVNAGGDCACGGIGPDGGGWRVGVEAPIGVQGLVLVLAVTDTGCATSSVRVRRWLAGGEPVHHIVDPRTRRPGGDGLLAVTVVAPDPAWSEVWSKSLFLTGRAGIRARADELGLAAAWVDDAGDVGTSTAMDPMVIWRAPRV